MVTVLQNVKVLFVALCAERRRRHPHMAPFGLVLHGAAGTAGPDCGWVRGVRPGVGGGGEIGYSGAEDECREPFDFELFSLFIWFLGFGSAS